MLDYFVFAYANLTHGFIYLTGNYFIAAGATLVLYDYPKKFTVKSILILLARILLSVVMIEFLASVYFAIFKNDGVVPFVCGALVTAFNAVIFSKELPWVRVTCSAAYMAACSLALSLTMSMGSLFGVEYYYLQWVMITVNGIMIFSEVLLIKSVSAPSETINSPIYYVVICVTSAICYAYAFVRRFMVTDPAAPVAVSLILIFMFLIVYITINAFTKKTYEDAQKQATELMRESDENALRMGKENLENLRALRHEIKNQYAVMKALLDEGEYGKLKSYFSSYTEKIDEEAGFTDYGNGILNAIAGVAKGRASSAGAKLECKIIVPESLEISDTDLTSVVVNLVNNAAEYVESAAELDDKTIKLEVYKINDTLLVKVTNAILLKDEERAKTLVTLKKNPELHGYGSKIVKSIAEHYGGKADFKVENGLFTASVLLFLKNNKEEEEQNA